MISQYEIGGNEIRTDASESIASIPENRTLLTEQLTSEEPVNPEIITGLTNMEQVFGHYKPHIEIEFQDGEGLPVKETFHFHNVDDFSVKNMTEQSSFLKETNTEKEFYAHLTRQLRVNKVLQRVLDNTDSRQAFISTLEALAAELGEKE
jgi:hypothetical protein